MNNLKPYQRVVFNLMKFTCIHLTLLVTGTLLSQAHEMTGQELLAKKVWVNVQHEQVKKVLNKIEKQASVTFSYNTQLLSSLNALSIGPDSLTIAETLDMMFDGAVKYEVVKNQILLISNRKVQPSTAAVIDINVGGLVTDDEGASLPGVNVIIKGTANGTTTDRDGKYTIDVPDANSILVFSFIGYERKEVVVGSETSINVSLALDIQSLEEVVVIGYGTQKRSSVTGAVSSVKAEQIQNIPARSINEALQGRVAGVQVTNQNGAPGANAQITIRGPLNIRGTEPLYVVDGIPFIGQGANFNIQDIESIEVLKDASAAAIYGAQGAGGVILITTKKGKAGTMSVGFNGTYGVRNVIKLPKLLRRDQYIDAKTKFGFDPTLLFGDPATRNKLPDTDWFDELFDPAIEQNYTLSLTGGSEKSTFYVSTNYQRAEGIRIDNSYERYTLRLNSEHQITKKLKFGQTLYGYFSNENPAVPVSQGVLSFRTTPVMPVYDPTNTVGGWGKTPTGFNGANDVGQELSNYRLEQNYDINLGFSLDYQIVEGLNARANFATSLGGFDNYYYQYIADYGVTGNRTDPFSREINKEQNFLANYTLTYAKTIDKHNFSAMAGYEARKRSFDRVKGASSTGLIPLPQSFDLVQTTDNEDVIGSAANNWRILSQFARITYEFNNKYLLTANVRRDGIATKFGPNNKYGIFPSISAGWRINEEAFMQSITAVTDLKLRASYGSLGNSDIDDFLFKRDYSSGFVADVGGGRSNSVNISTKLSNPDIKWETVNTFDIGLDATFLSRKLSVTLDWYNRTTKDMLYNVPLPRSAGSGNTVAFNIGEMQNKGFEFVLGYNDKAGAFTYGLTLNGAFNTNQLITLNPNLDQQQLQDGRANEFYGNTNLTRTTPGQPLGQFWGYVVEGIYQDDVNKGDRPAIGGTADRIPVAGDLIYRDMDGNGKIDNNDKQFIGNPWPKLIYGFNVNLGFKNFSLLAQFNGVQGVDIYNAAESYYHNFFSDYNTTAAINDVSFFGDNGLTDVPRIGTLANRDKNGNWSQVSSYHVQDGSYLRLRNVQIGYALPQVVLDKIKVKQLRLFVMADNLFTVTKYKGLNPDLGFARKDGRNEVRTLGIDNGNNVYPISRLYSVGINATF